MKNDAPDRAKTATYPTRFAIPNTHYTCINPVLIYLPGPLGTPQSVQLELDGAKMACGASCPDHACPVQLLYWYCGWGSRVKTEGPGKMNILLHWLGQNRRPNISTGANGNPDAQMHWKGKVRDYQGAQTPVSCLATCVCVANMPSVTSIKLRQSKSGQSIKSDGLLPIAPSPPSSQRPTTGTSCC